MRTFILLLLLALMGLGIAVYTVSQDDQVQAVDTPSIALPVFSPPFKHYIAGVGVVEPLGGEHSIGTPVTGIATQIMVKPGDEVNAGDVLFKLDDRTVREQLLSAQANLKQAEATYQLAKHHLQTAERLQNTGHQLAISQASYQDRQDEAAIAKAAVAAAKARVVQLQQDSQRYQIHAPFSGRILQVSLREGEYADSNRQTGLIIMGKKSQQLRVSIDEQDAWRYQTGAEAIAYRRGYGEQAPYALKFAYIEPYIVPKTTLTGSSTERTDSRVLNVYYQLDSSESRLYVGQQLDVFIKAGE